MLIALPIAVGAGIAWVIAEPVKTSIWFKTRYTSEPTSYELAK